MFWPTADAEIDGVRPSYWQKYDGGFPNGKRVEKVLEWLKLPEAERPHFITLYFSDVDSAGHSFGPDAHETDVYKRQRVFCPCSWIPATAPSGRGSVSAMSVPEP